MSRVQLLKVQCAFLVCSAHLFTSSLNSMLAQVCLAGSSPISLESHSAAVASADLNGDGYLDLATTQHGLDTITLLWGDGSGEFVEGPIFPVAAQPRGIAAADFTGDGLVDLAIGHTIADVIWVMSGDGSGQFTLHSTTPGGTFPRILKPLDFNEDGWVDLVSPEWVFINAGGTLVATHELDPFGYDVDWGDFNRDGSLDLIVCGTISTPTFGGLALFLGTPANGLAPPQTLNFPGLLLFEVRALTLGDFDADGNLDIVFGSDLALLSGNGDGTFAAPIAGPPSGSPAAYEKLETVDVDDDGTLDVVASAIAGGGAVFLGNGNGGFSSAIRFRNKGNKADLICFDADATGSTDVLTIGDSIELFLNITGSTNCAGNGQSFLRGDTNVDGLRAIDDAIWLVGYYRGLNSLECFDSADLNDDSAIDITDILGLFGALFYLPGFQPPFFECGFEEYAADGLGCQLSLACP